MRLGMAPADHVLEQACFSAGIIGYGQFQAEIAADKKPAAKLTVIADCPGHAEEYESGCEGNEDLRHFWARQASAVQQVSHPGEAEQQRDRIEQHQNAAGCADGYALGRAIP